MPIINTMVSNNKDSRYKITSGGLEGEYLIENVDTSANKNTDRITNKDALNISVTIC